MKLCKDCKFHTRRGVQVGPGQAQLMDMCVHEECCDVVTGDPLPCGHVRGLEQMCGFEAKNFQQKEEQPDKKVIIT